MKIGGFQKTSLLDYPDKISAIVWTVGCNFRCPFCYNKELVVGNPKLISEDDIFSFLEKRKGLLEGLVITGGEPLMQKDIVEFLTKVKKLGYLIKIDTNGMYPDMLEDLIDKKVVDYVSMDIKSPKKKYDSLAGKKVDFKKIEKSVDIIKKKVADYEFRTTFVPALLDKNDILEIGKWLKGSKKFYLQKFKNNVELIDPNLEDSKYYSDDEILDALKKVKPYFVNCDIRGI
jgi:pyruvate formate lyase activating enzyme